MADPHPDRAPVEREDKRGFLQKLAEFIHPGPDSRDELIETLADAEDNDVIGAESRVMLEGVLRMADMTAGDVMVAAPRMDLVNIDAPFDALLHLVIDTAHSRFPVYEGEKENIIGILLAKDLLKLQRAPELNIRALLRPATFVPESKGLNDLLREFRGNRNHLAIVIDEFGRVAGLITIEDVLEQIVGEIEDEFDIAEDEGDIFGLADHTYRVSRRHAHRARGRSLRHHVRRRAAERRLRHHRRPDRARDGPRAQARRAPRDGRPSTSSCCTPRAARCAGSRSRRRAAATRPIERADRAPVRASGARAAGLAQAASIAAPWNGQPLWWLQLLSLAALVWQLDGLLRRRPARLARAAPARLALRHGLAVRHLLVALHLDAHLRRAGGAAAPRSPCLRWRPRWALYYALACGAVCGLRAHASPWRARPWCLPRCGLLAELLRGQLFTGFPWGAGGYAHVDGCWPLARLARRLWPRRCRGRHRGGWPARATSVAARGRACSGACALALVASCVPMPARRLRPPGRRAGASRRPHQVALLQGNIPQDEKFIPAAASSTALRWYGEQLRDATAPLVVTPETALPLLP